MATAYTPGLKVTARTSIRKTRRLPLKGEVVVKVGDTVSPGDTVARTDLPGIMQTVRVAESLGIEPPDVPRYLRIVAGQTIKRGDIVAEMRTFFGLFRNEAKCPVDGTVELISQVTGHVGIRHRPTPVEVDAYIDGRVVEVIPGEGVVIQTTGALIQGIFGVGGERLGEIVVAVKHPGDTLDETGITEDLAGKVVVAGANITGGGLRRAAEVGAAAVIVGGILDRDLIDYLGYDIGVAITGQEHIPTTLIVTEGFGVMSIAERTFELLKSMEGRRAAVNGATQIRAGVIRPEIIVPDQSASDVPLSEGSGQSLDPGSRIRVIREPWFGRLGRVISLPPEPVTIDSGASVRILEAELDGGERVSVPRANVEIIEG